MKRFLCMAMALVATVTLAIGLMIAAFGGGPAAPAARPQLALSTSSCFLYIPILNICI